MGNDARSLVLSLIGKDVSASTALKGVGTSAEQTETKVGGLNKGMQLAMAAGGVAAVGFAKKSADAFTNVGTEVLKLQRYTGGSAEDMSRLRFAAQQTGTDIDVLAKSLGIASKNIEAGKWAKLGIDVQDASGKVKPMNELLLSVADKFQAMPNGAEKTALAMQLFGKAGADMIPFLNRGTEGLQKLMGETDQYSLVLSGDNLNAVKAAKEAQRQLSAEWEGLQVQIGERVLPIMTKFTSALAHIPGPIMDIVVPLATFGGGLAGVALVASKVATGIKPAIDGIGSLATKLSDSSGVAGRMTAALGGANQVIGTGAVAVGGAIAVYEIWNARMQQAYDNARKLGDVVTEGNKSGTFDEMAGRIGKINEQIADLSNEIDNSHAPWDADYRAEMEAYKTQLEQSRDGTQKQVDAIRALSDATGDTTEKVKAWLQNEATAGRTYDTTAAALAAYTGNIDENALSSDEAASATKGYTDKIKEQNDVLHASLDPLFGLTSALEQNASAQSASTQANTELFKAQVAYNQLPSAENLKAVNDAILAKQQADEGAVRTALDVTTATSTLNGAIQTGTVSLEGARDMLNQWVAAGLITQAQADQVGAKFGFVAGMANSIPRDVHSTVTADTSQAIDAYYRLAQAKSQADPYNTAYAKDADRSRVGNRASGGPLDNGWTWVGEQGPELARKSGGNVEIFSASQSRSMVGGGGVNVVANFSGVVGDPREAARMVLDLVRDALNEPGARGLN